MVTLPLVPWQKADGAASASSRGTGEASSGASQPAAAESAGTRARCTAFDSTAATSPAEDGDFPDADVFREIAEQVKRSPQEIEEHWQHCEGAGYHAAILAGKKALAEGKLKEEVAAVIESAGGEVCGLENRRWPSSCQKKCIFPQWDKGNWLWHAPCHGVKNHEGAHLCHQHWEVNPDDWHAGRMT